MSRGGSEPATSAGAVADYLGMVGRHQHWRAMPTARESIPFSEFRQIIRRYRPSELLPALAELAVALGEPPYGQEIIATCPPWAIALAARESVLWGNEHRSTQVTGDSLRRILNAHNDIYESGATTDESFVLDVMTRLVYEQFPYQESIFEEVSRSHALMVEGANETPVEVLNDGAWTQLLGAPLGQVVGATFFLQVAANTNKGWFDPAFLDREDLQPLYESWPRDVIEDRADRLSYTFDQFKRSYSSVPQPPRGFERFAYNPLVRRPFVRMPGGRILAPQPRLILRTVSPGGLYYLGMEQFGEPFSRDLGVLTEQYVGRQLRSIQPQPELYPEIVYREGRAERRSIDWFLVLDSAVIMFEVKSARFGLLDRAAVGDYQARVRRLLDKATMQLEGSSEAIAAANSSFRDIPGDRPRVGIIVTGEPYYLANSPWMRDLLRQAPFPTLVASLRDIEFLAGLPLAEIEAQLVKIATDPQRSTWSLGSALDRASATRNPVLQRAWQAYPWPAATGSSDAG